jgi:hypothetical protein
MIRSLRQRHRLVVTTLGILLPVAFVSGIAGRRQVPLVGSLPAQLAPANVAPGNVVWTKTDTWPNQRIVTSLRRDGTGSAGVELQSDLLKPDVLVYWAPGDKSTPMGLPESARLLGSLANGSPLAVTPDMRSQSGQLVLYSLADHEILAVSKPITF